MAFKTRLIGRWLALPLVGVHLLLAGATVPHCHERVTTTGVERVADHHHPHPHRHLAWGGHSHAGDHHDDRAAGPPLAPVDHDGDAIYLADAFLAVGAGPFDVASRGAMPWVALPPEKPSGAVAGARRPGRFVRPPGERRGMLHERMPHVLRV
jgi:hypothetical protein